MILTDSELGKKSAYPRVYDPALLFIIPREDKRREIGIVNHEKVFFGFDLWNHYEVSWLNAKGKPMVAHASIWFDCNSPNIIESKSLKLYFNALNNTRFESISDILMLLQKDLSNGVGAPVFIELTPSQAFQNDIIKNRFEGVNLDELDISCDDFILDPKVLQTENSFEEEVLCSDLLKSNCLVTHQPDWGSVQIHYRGPKINHESLLRYLISFRDHNEFHEQCIERIFMDIKKYCQPEKLTVYGRYTRRGGLDINPYRSTEQNYSVDMKWRLYRQ